MTYRNIIVDREDGVATIVLSRPKALLSEGVGAGWRKMYESELMAAKAKSPITPVKKRS